MQPAWRLIADAEGEAAENMARDEAIFEAFQANLAPPTLRLYGWRHWSLTLGRFQTAARTTHWEEAQRREIAVVRRITGGRGILHGDDLTVTVVASAAHIGLGGEAASIVALYRRLAEGFLFAFEKLGVPATLGGCTRPLPVEAHGDCFASASQADIVHAQTGEKLLGSALHRRGDCFLQQVSIPLGTPALKAQRHELTKALFRGTMEAQEVSRFLEGVALRLEIAHGFANTFGVALQEESLSALELARAQTLLTARYQRETWNRAGTQEADLPCVV